MQTGRSLSDGLVFSSGTEGSVHGARTAQLNGSHGSHESPRAERRSAKAAVVPKLAYFDSLLRPWAYFDTLPKAVDQLIAGAAFYGGILFTIGGFSGSSQYLVKANKVGLTNAYNWLVYFTFFVGTYFFTVGCFLISVAAINGDEVMDLQDQKRYKHYMWFAWQPHSKAWVGGIIYTAGALLYNLGATVNLADQFPAVQLSAVEELWLETYSFLIGGIGFLLGGYLLVVEREGWNVLTGILIPFRKSDWRSFTWWINWCNFWGGVLFCLGGFFLPFPLLDPWVLALGNGLGFGVGSLLFTVGGLLSYMKLSLAYSRPALASSVAMTPRSDAGKGSVHHV